MSNPTTPAEVVLGQGMSGGNPTTVAAVNRMPPEFQSAYSQAKAANWVKPDRSTWYPPNDGAVGTPTRTTLDPGRAVDRYGGEGGSYLDNPGDPAAARALPPQSDRGEENAYSVEQPTDVEQAPIAPWFDDPGGRRISNWLILAERRENTRSRTRLTTVI